MEVVHAIYGTGTLLHIKGRMATVLFDRPARVGKKRRSHTVTVGISGLAVA